MKVLAFDPGKNHFAWAVVVLDVSGQAQVLHHGFLINVLHTLGDITDQTSNFCKEFKDIIKQADLDSSVDRIAVERFMHRPGFGKGAVGEFINIQIGMVASTANIPVHLLPSSLWKNHMKRHYGTNDSLKLFDPYSKQGYKVHETDAMGIAVYCIEKETGKRLLQPVPQEILDAAPAKAGRKRKTAKAAKTTKAK